MALLYFNFRYFDFIEEHVLDKKTVRKILIKILEKNAIKWYDIPQNYNLVKHVVARFVEKELLTLANKYGII